MRRRMAILLALLAALLGVAAVWCWGQVAARRRAAIQARDDLAACRQMTDLIADLGRRQTIAEERERRSSEVAGPIEQAAKAAGIAAGEIIRINPAPQRRIEGTAYKEKPTQVFLKRVSLKALVAMLHALSQSDQPLHPSAIRLTAPNREDTGSQWDAEVVLTYLVYDPARTTP
ncbi:MAG: hypothetical protein NTX40_00125 [Planctomycetota bacterium]|nr:hypothetical protein [Planctomycetota bacterium]